MNKETKEAGNKIQYGNMTWNHKVNGITKHRGMEIKVNGTKILWSHKKQ